MDLFGSIMFPNLGGDPIPMIYLELVRDLEPDRKYNWGGAVLAHLYFNLYQSCQIKNKVLYGPVLLLQHWAWSRLPVGVLVPNESPEWGVSTSQDCHAFGKKWYGHHVYRNQPHRKTVGIRLVRGQIQGLGDTQVIWTPYQELYSAGRLPQTVADDSAMWLYRGPLVCFWIVEFHYPDRVLRQFGYPPFFPVDPDVPRSETRRLRGTTHGNHPGRDWSQHYEIHYDRARNMSDNLWHMPENEVQFQGDY